ncbi:hypothetical protein CYMTET_15607 [Cymbomonas tetramitiformis]|uniref:Uncharacterized protein n=1 Tax=Cymbomonas tetramitiformis TaxID=36881 RepID=A0AAE0GE87_9CHLO|nr:hypothetical protein CYMTET_15607 [Cymbomonas tetramitiformis]
MAGMRLVEVIPTHDERGVPTQLFETPDGVLHDLPWPVLVVHAPPTRQLAPRVRHPRVAPPIVRQGKAAETRDASSLPTDVTFLESLHDEYARAGPLQQLRDDILAAPHHATRDFRIVGNVLWRVAAGRYQLVLGEDSPLREVVFRDAHDSTTAGHTGREKTLERVLRRFWWKNASEDVAGWVASCPTCQAVRPRASYPDGLLNPHAIPQRNWQDVSVDFVTGLPLTAQGNDAFVTFTCKLSKMVHLVPMNFGDSSAQTVARIYFDVVWRQHGAPMKIVCDRDPRFQDSFWRELMRLMGVRVASTTPYNPRSDGQAEHTNRVVEDMLRSFVGANPDDWDLYMTNVEFAINDSRSDVTGFTPFELCYGVSPMSQLDLFLEAATLPGSARRKGGVGTAHEMAVKFSSQLRDARGRLELAQQRQREQFDRRHKQHRYAVGDLVWIEARHLTEKVMDRALCRKLGKRWHGPVTVVECFYSDLQAELAEADRGAPVAYRLALPPHWRIHDVFAQHRLKPYVSGMDEFASRAQLPVPDPVMVDGQAEAHVDKILAYRVRMVKGKSVEEWKVRWTGYSAAHDQWRSRDKMDRGGENQQLKEFEARRLGMQADMLKSVEHGRRQRQQRQPVHLGVTLSQLMEHQCDVPEVDSPPEDFCLPWERVEILENGELVVITDLEERKTRPVRILVLFSGTGSVEREFAKCFPSASVVTLDNDPRWQPDHLASMEDWDPTQYPPGFFDVIWASPPCTQYSQARTTGGPPDLEGADKSVKCTLDAIEYLKPKHWFLENPEGRYPNALRLRQDFSRRRLTHEILQLRSFVGANPDDWDLYMTNVEFAINDSRSDVTGFTPFELCYGVSPMSQLDLFLEAATLPGSARRKGGVGTAHEMAAKFSSQLRDARGRLELAQQRQREQFDRRHKQHKYAVGDLVWIEARHLTEKVMDRALCRKLGKRWHGPVTVVECFYSDLQAELAEADRGAPVAYRLALPPHWRIHDVFAQHRLKPYISGKDEFASRAQLPVPDPVMVDGQAEAHVDKILAYRVRMVKGKSVEEWKVRWTGYSAAHDQWRSRDKMDRGGENQQLKEFEARRLGMQADMLKSTEHDRRQRQQRQPAHLGVTLSQLMEHPCDVPEVDSPREDRLSAVGASGNLGEWRASGDHRP